MPLFETETLPLHFEVYGEPAPKGSKTAMVINGEVRLVEGASSAGRRKLGLWQADMEEVFSWFGRGKAPLDEPVEATVDFHMPRVASDPYRARHCVKPDVDKLVRAVFDSLTKAKVWKDDSLCFRVTATKRYVDRGEEPGCVVTLRPCGEAEQADRQGRKQEAQLRRRFDRR
jgi:Holliday junction resolvase RusA-like endonuclease